MINEQELSEEELRRGDKANLSILARILNWPKKFRKIHLVQGCEILGVGVTGTMDSLKSKLEKKLNEITIGDLEAMIEVWRGGPIDEEESEGVQSSNNNSDQRGSFRESNQESNSESVRESRGTKRKSPEVQELGLEFPDEEEEEEDEVTINSDNEVTDFDINGFFKVFPPGDEYFKKSMKPEKRKNLDQQYPRFVNQPADVPKIDAAYISMVPKYAKLNDKEMLNASRMFLKSTYALAHLNQYVISNWKDFRSVRDFQRILKDAMQYITVGQELLSQYRKKAVAFSVTRTKIPDQMLKPKDSEINLLGDDFAAKLKQARKVKNDLMSVANRGGYNHRQQIRQGRGQPFQPFQYGGRFTNRFNFRGGQRGSSQPYRNVSFRARFRGRGGNPQ